MVSVPLKVGAIFPQRLIQHHGGDFVEGLRTDVGIVGARQGRVGMAEFGKGGEKRGGSEDQNLAILGKRRCRTKQVLKRLQGHEGTVVGDVEENGKPTKGEQLFNGFASQSFLESSSKNFRKASSELRAATMRRRHSRMGPGWTRPRSNHRVMFSSAISTSSGFRARWSAMRCHRSPRSSLRK